MDAERARKNLSALLRAVARVGQKPVADAAGVSVATISRWTETGEWQRIADILAALGQKSVDEQMQCFRSADIDALLTLAKGRLQQVETAAQLLQDWED